MNATELAHWRYRVKALTVDLADCNRVMGSVGFLYQVCATEEDAIRQAQKLSDERELTRWLLEEAKYYSELGELTLT